MIGNKLNVAVQGPSIDADKLHFTIVGDTRYDSIAMTEERIPFIDAAAVHHEDGSIYVSLINRSPDAAYPVTIDTPLGYTGESIWTLSHGEINARNSDDNCTEIVPSVRRINTGQGHVDTEILPCGLQIIRLEIGRAHV